MISIYKLSIFLIFIPLGYYSFYIGYKNLGTPFTNFKESKSIENIDEKNFELESPSKTINNIAIDKKKSDKYNLNKIEIRVKKGETLYSILKKYKFKDKEIYEINTKVEDFFNLNKLKTNQKINFYSNNTGKIKQIKIFLSVDTILIVHIKDIIKVEKSSEKTFTK